jgi:prepilin-type N-terminal cleavage/methylation domain-containing protein
VPSLLRLARVGRRGFTLVELLIAVALSSIIVVSAVACFQMVAKVVRAANAMSTENGLLRSGFMLAMLDVDYWHSHADPNPPYNKG